MENINWGKILEQATNSDKKLSIKLLGDSITHGEGGTGFCQDGAHIVAEFSRNPNGFCWAKMFKEYLEEKYNCVVTNNACTGTTIDFTIENFNILVDESDDLILCTIGTNNRHQYKNEGEKKTREELWESVYNNILHLNKLFEERNKLVVFVANIPSSLENEMDGEDYWRILHMPDINEIYKKAQEKAGFKFISMYDLFSMYMKENNETLDQLLCDGIHPNDKGYKVIFELLIKTLGL